MLAVGLFNPQVIFGIGGVFLTFVVVPLVTYISMRYGAKQWRDVAEGRGEEIHDLRERLAAQHAASDEKDKRVELLETMVKELGGASVIEALKVATESILKALEGHEKRAEARGTRMLGLIQTVGDTLAEHGPLRGER